MSTTRKYRVLNALVREYVDTFEPVGSKTLVENYNLGVSSATVRNDLSSLEKSGFVMQPHISAGRVPTDSGYRKIVDTFLKNLKSNNNQDGPSKKLLWKANLIDSSFSKNTIKEVGEYLSEVTKCLVLITEPTSKCVSVSNISLIPVEQNKLVIVFVVSDGRVVHRQIDIGNLKKDQISISVIESRLNNALVGSLTNELLLNISKDLYLVDELSGHIIRELISMADEIERQKMHQFGMAALLSQPEFRSANKAALVLNTLESSSLLLHEIINTTVHEQLMVKIGRENEDESLSELSIVAVPYERAGSRGALGLVGPTRLNYPFTIASVWAIADVLEKPTDSFEEKEY